MPKIFLKKNDKEVVMEISGEKIVERIDFCLKKNKQNRVAMCKVLDKNPNLIAAWKMRNSIPQADIALEIADYLGVSIRWLITGQDEEGADPETDQMLRDWGMLDMAQRKMVAVQIKALAEEKNDISEIV